MSYEKATDMKTELLQKHIESIIASLTALSIDISRREHSQIAHVRNLLESTHPLPAIHTYLDRQVINDQADTEFANEKRQDLLDILHRTIDAISNPL